MAERRSPKPKTLGSIPSSPAKLQESAMAKSLTSYDTTKINDAWRPSCPFCHVPWTEDMIKLEASASSGCETCGPDVEASIKITCASCKKLIYQKDYN